MNCFKQLFIQFQGMTGASQQLQHFQKQHTEREGRMLTKAALTMPQVFRKFFSSLPLKKDRSSLPFTSFYDDFFCLLEYLTHAAYKESAPRAFRVYTSSRNETLDHLGQFLTKTNNHISSFQIELNGKKISTVPLSRHHW
jgi:TorA maturation chaperone TorD